MPAWHGQPQKTRYAFTVSGIASTFGGVANDPPVWQNVPHITFFVGITSTFPISGTYQSNNYVTDANFDTIVITKNNVFVQGVNWDGGKFTSNGTGSQTTVTGHILTADDGHNSNVQSSPFHIAIIPGAVSWTSVPSVSFVEGSTTPYNLGQNILNYNASTDEFRVTPTYSLPSWMSLTPGPGTGSGNLTPNGTQLDADDDVGTPRRIDVRRSGGAWVSSAAFGVTVTAAPATFGSIDDLAYEGPATGAASSTGKHANIQYCPLDGAFYIHGGDGGMAIPGGSPPDSGSIHSLRWTFNANATNVTEDLYYPYWGYVGEFMPGGAGCNSWQWDNSRSCFWSAGGIFEGLNNFNNDPRRVGIGPTSNTDGRRIWRFDLTGALAFRWQALTAAGVGLHGEGHGAVYVPAPYDCLFAFNGDTSRRLHWYNCATGAIGGPVTVGLTTFDSPYSGPFSGVTPDNANDGLNEDPMIYDPVNNEIIWQCHDSNYAGLYATSLANFPGNLTTRQLWRGFENGGVFAGYGQKPLFIRNRKLYSFCFPYGSRIDGATVYGNGLGIYELDLTTLEMRQGSQPHFDLYDDFHSAPLPMYGVNEGGYSPVADAFLAPHRFDGSGNPLRVGMKPLIFKWTPPSWTPAEGFVKAITTDSAGAATNSISSVWAPGGPHTAVIGPASIVTAWGSAVYARNLSTNGCMLLWNGGDQDYWGNEVYCFDFDMRRWKRLTSPLTIGGNISTDVARAISDPLHFSASECEHGRQDAITLSNGTWGLLPTGTEPGVPHNYSGPQYVPGEFVGNRRGALVSAFQVTTYASQGTMRAHYLDLDQVLLEVSPKWGRLSTNKPTYGSTTTTHCVFDEEAGRIYHNWGYLDLNAKQQVVAGGGGTVGSDIFGLNANGFHLASCFDPERRLILLVQGSGIRAVSVGPAGSAPTTTAANLTFAGDPLWLGDQAQHGGICYCPTLDCFFFYNQGFVGQTLTPQVIWKLVPPASNPLSNAWTVSRITMPTTAQGGVDIVNDTNTHGNYGRFMWVPPLKCLAFLNTSSGYVYLYKPVGV